MSKIAPASRFNFTARVVNIHSRPCHPFQSGLTNRDARAPLTQGRLREGWSYHIPFWSIHPFIQADHAIITSLQWPLRVREVFDITSQNVKNRWNIEKFGSPIPLQVYVWQKKRQEFTKFLFRILLVNCTLPIVSTYVTSCLPQMRTSVVSHTRSVSLYERETLSLIIRHTNRDKMRKWVSYSQRHTQSE